MASFQGESDLATITNTVSDYHRAQSIHGDADRFSSLQVFCSQILQLQTPDSYRVQKATVDVRLPFPHLLSKVSEMPKLAFDILSAPPPSGPIDDVTREAFWGAKGKAIAFIHESSMMYGLDFVPLSMLTSTSEVLKQLIEGGEEASPPKKILLQVLSWFKNWYVGGWFGKKNPATFHQLGLGGCFLSSLVDDLMFYLSFSEEDCRKIPEGPPNHNSIHEMACNLVGLLLFISSSGEDGCGEDVFLSAMASLEGPFGAFKTTKNMEEARRLYGAICCLCEWGEKTNKGLKIEDDKKEVDMSGTKTALSSVIQKLVVPLLSECSEFKREFPFVIAQGLKVLPFALGALSDKEIVDLCLSFLEESSVLVRLSALISLGKMVDAVERERYEVVFPERKFMVWCRF